VSAVLASPAAKESEMDSVRALQHALYRAAKAGQGRSGRRFHSLWDKILRRDVLERAWEDVRRNGGAAGIDRVTITDVEEYGVSRLLDEVAAALREGRWRPLPSRRVFIPKPGSSEQRPLSIPNQSQTAATNATISVESGYSPSLFDSVIAFPFASSTPILAPGQMSSGGNLRPKFGLPANMIAVNYSLGFDSSRTAASNASRRRS